MRKILTFAIAAISLSALISCGKTNNDGTKPSNPSTPTVEPTLPAPDTTPDTPDVEELSYTTKVLLPNGSVYKERALPIQYCNRETKVCLKAIKTNADGISVLNEANGLEEDAEYIVHILDKELEKSYAYNINAYLVNPTTKDIAIQLYDRVALGSEAGTKADPKLITKAGAYHLDFEAKAFVEFKFTPAEAGKYTLEGFGAQINAANPAASILYWKGDGSEKAQQIDKGGIGKNFKLTFDVEAGKEYTFAIGINESGSYPNGFDFLLSATK